MKTLLFLALIAVAGYWNYRTSRDLKAQNDEIQKLKDQLEAQQSTQQTQRTHSKGDQEQVVRDLRSKLQAETAVLASASEALARAKNFGTNQSTVNQIRTEAKDQKRTLDELNRQIQTTQQQLNQLNQEGKSTSEASKATHKQNDIQIQQQIDDQSSRIRAAEAQIQDLKRRKYDLSAREQLQSLNAQMPEARATLQTLRAQKRQFDADWASQKGTTDSQEKSYKASLQQTLNDLKQRRDDENGRLTSTNSSLGQVSGEQNSAQGNLNQLNQRYNDEKSKVETLERTLREEEERLRQFQ